MTLPTALTHPCYHDDEAARVTFEAIRWPDGPFCPFCGAFDTVAPLGGKSMGPGWYWCNKCREKFTVRVGSVMERSHIPMHKWLLAFRLMAGSKKGVSAHYLHRTLGVAYRSAWFMAHRIRLAMDIKAPSPLGGDGKFVEADETYVGGKARNRKGKTPKKEAVFSLVERGGGARSFHVANVTAKTLRPIIVSVTDRKSHFRTDHSAVYWGIGDEFKTHHTVNHAIEEYVRGDAYTNTVEGYFSIFKRGIYGVYHHVSEGHLHRYLAEFDFRYNNRAKLGVDDTERARRAIAGAAGKRLTYRQPNGQAHA
ncbi:MAG: IS1595 family transposase [Alphaproteobacteria bacterium]